MWDRLCKPNASCLTGFPLQYHKANTKGGIIMSKQLFLNENPLLILPELAKRIGLNEAIVLQQIHYWLVINENKQQNYHDGRYWTFNTYSDLQKQFSFWSEITIKRIVAKLKSNGYILVGNYNKYKYDRTNWYSIDYSKLS